jgi:biopolymer transport protein TolR
MVTVAAMVRRRSPKLFTDFNNFQFAGVFGIVVLVVLLIFITDSSHYHYSTSVDLPKVLHPVPMPWADREDAMIVSVPRDGRVYFGVDQLNPAALAQKIADRLKDHSVERKVYIKADMRARWGAVKQALDAVRAAGILRVVILTDQRRAIPGHL